MAESNNLRSSLLEPSQLAHSIYKLKISILEMQDEEFIVPNTAISGFAIHKDFINNFFPILQIKFFTNMINYHKIQTNRNKIKVKISFEQMISNGVDATPDENAVSILEECVFQPFGIPNDPAVERMTILAKAPTNKEDPTKFNLNDDMEVNLSLFHLKNLNDNKQMINVILKECTVIDAIGYILNTANGPTTLLQEPDNTEQIKPEIFIPPLNLRNSLHYLQKVYGIYKSGLLTFFDWSRLYIMSNAQPKDLLEEGEYENVYIDVGVEGSFNNQKGGYYINDTDKYYLLLCQDAVQYSYASNYSKEIDGNVIKSTNFKKIYDSTTYDGASSFDIKDDTFVETAVALESHKESVDKVFTTYNHLENPYLESELKYIRQRSNLRLKMAFMGVDISFITPNKNFNVVFQSKEIDELFGGIYKLVNMDCVGNIINTRGHLSLATVIELEYFADE